LFTPQLAAAKRQGLAEYGALASSYVMDFDRKWLHSALQRILSLLQVPCCSGGPHHALGGSICATGIPTKNLIGMADPLITAARDQFIEAFESAQAAASI
jgi:hypothetical protein